MVEILIKSEAYASDRLNFLRRTPQVSYWGLSLRGEMAPPYRLTASRRTASVAF